MIANDTRDAPRVFAAEIARLFAYIGQPELPLEHGLDRGVLEDRETTVPVDRWYDLIEVATAASGDPFLGLHFGGQSQVDLRQRSGAMRLLVLSSDTIRVAVDRVLRYQSYWNQAERYQIDDGDGRFTVRYTTWGPHRQAHVQVAEKMVAQSLRFVRAANRGCVPLAIRLPHARRAGCEELARLLHREPEFCHPCTEIEFDSAVLDARLPTADAVLFQVLDRDLAERVRDATPESAFSDRTRKAISDYLHRQELSIAVVSKVLRTSEPTLQRHLTDEGTSFRDLVDEVRRSRALSLLEVGATVGELSLVLGYAEESDFCRSFTRWTGATPESWRSRRPAPQPGVRGSGAFGGASGS